jgi:hypothetical protein
MRILNTERLIRGYHIDRSRLPTQLELKVLVCCTSTTFLQNNLRAVLINLAHCFGGFELCRILKVHARDPTIRIVRLVGDIIAKCYLHQPLGLVAQ